MLEEGHKAAYSKRPHGMAIAWLVAWWLTVNTLFTPRSIHVVNQACISVCMCTLELLSKLVCTLDSDGVHLSW